MDLDAAHVDVLSTEKKGRLQKEGQCFTCKRMGHLSCNCPNKKKDAPSPTQNSKTNARMIEPEEQNDQKQIPKEAMAEQIKAMSTEERNVLLDNLVLQGF